MLDTKNRSEDPKSDRERGQTLVLFALMLTVMLGFVALTVDVGLAFLERRQLQNAVDAAALAAAQDLSFGQSNEIALATAYDYMDRNGYSGAETIDVNIPPLYGPFAGLTGYVEVQSKQKAPAAFLTLFMDEALDVAARAVAKGTTGQAGGAGPGGNHDVGINCNFLTGQFQAGCEEEKTAHCQELEGDARADCEDAALCEGAYEAACKAAATAHCEELSGNAQNDCEDQALCEDDWKKICEDTYLGVNSNAPPPAVVPADAVCGSPVVDGRVMASEGYTKLGDLTGGSTDFGDFFYGCDATYIYFAMVLNANSPTGVANENVYGDDDYIDGYRTGWEKTHTFGKLLGSDRARFQIACDGVVVHDFIQDYLRGDSGQNGWASDALGNGKILGGGPAQSASSLEFNLENPTITGWGDDSGEDPQDSSPPYNPSYGSWDAEYDGFVWEMIYEFKVPAADYAGCTQVQFGLHNFAGESGQLEGLHSSPAKTDEGITLLIEISELKLVE